ncbi:hypothetical protein N7457_007962 [Penicillium paradoxum]|uniref:uncharacterized protein n=1 Tax=Penicillium paradoxum TaxID=176176 RepID=UPI002547482A|nr:uncharacterized protein N7457_007962 [Penicillium paradoxum]KAJ5773066.1 hypothetical protein N7457_007962 [Penicillium paradoxum]
MESSEKLRPLLRRPESSAIDVVDFSFGKPASHKPFSLRNMPKQAPITHPQIDDTQPSGEQTGEGTGISLQLAQPATMLNTAHSKEKATTDGQNPARQSLLHQPIRRRSMTAGSSKEMCGGSAIEKAAFGQSQVSVVAQPSEPTRVNTPRQNIGPAGKGAVLVQHGVDEIEGTSEASSALPEPAIQHSHRERQETAENQVPRVPLKPIHNQLQALKRYRASEKESNTKSQAALIGTKHSVQLSEDDLFELLIKRMKQREETEHAATLIQRQVKNENSALKEQNLVLQDRLKKCQGQLAKTSSESRAQRAQIDKWKEKLGMFKGILNELGREYGVVREHSKVLKETTVSLAKEKSEIQQNLVDIKLQVSNYAEKIQGQRDKLLNSETTVSRLKEALNHSEKRGELIKAQLSNEKRRIATLENYIQNESQSQARYLALVRNDQRKMAEKFDSACELFITSCVKSQDVILSKLSPKLEQCVDSVQKLQNQCVTEAINVQDFTKSVEQASFGLNSLAEQVARDVDRGTEINKSVFQALQEALQAIEANLGPCSSIFKQLANTESCYGNLQRQLEVAEPMLGTLGNSVKAIETTEIDLMRGLEMFGQKLSEARIPAGNPVLEMEISNKFAENTQLQLQLQESTTQVESLRKQLATRSSENQHLQHTLTETVTKEQASKSQISRLEIEKTALRGELQLLEQRIREELGIASMKLQDQMNARFTEQVHDLEREKTKLKRDCDHLQLQLENVQNSLAETEKTAEGQRMRQDSMLEESKKRMETLNDSCSKYIAEAKANEAESKLLRDSGASLRKENDSLLEQLQRVKGKTTELEAILAKKTESETLKAKAAQEAETKANLLELEAAQATGELKAMTESLAMLKSRSSALEKVGEEADAEIVSLLRRAQEAESWQATIREGFAKVIDVQPDEPFEQTWQKLEDMLQSSLARSLIAHDASCAKLQHTDSTEATQKVNIPLDKLKGKDDHAVEIDQSDKGVGPAAGNLSPKIGSPSKALKHGHSVDSPPKRPPGLGHIVPFSSVHDRLSREDSLSLFNDPAELEMLFMSTPDFQGGLMQGDTLKGAQEPQMVPVDSQTTSREHNLSNPALKKQPSGNESAMPPSTIEKFENSSIDASARTELPKTKRKVVSFEGTRIFTETEVGRARRMSDATDNSSGRESESAALKKTQKRTYSRLRQSVAQEESSIETTTDVQRGKKTLEEKSQRGTINKANHSSRSNPRPPKRPRNEAHDPGRRLSPQGLASGSSRSNAADQISGTRGRGKRRTRGMVI